MNEGEEVNSDDVIRIMVSTDNHLGYCEKDPIRGEDSFIAFEEMLTMAVEENVDFILLGGDLFHDSVPSQNAMHKCIKLLRRYVFGDKSIPFEILSDQTLNFFNSVNDTVNYEDPNLNISIPVFSIHGNHDDPSSFGCLSALDLLSTGGLVNYIGRSTDLTKINIKPLLLQKGESKLAIYGLSHIHDERLSRLFTQYKVDIECPEGDKDDWFHLMVVHQNRAMRGHKNYLEEDILPDFLNLVIWGHEHDCRIEPEHVVKKDFYISQPGSSVATSLAEGESIKKHVGILEIYKNKFKLKPMPLQTVRPFIYESIDLDVLADAGELDGADASEKVRTMAEERIGDMIERSKKLITGNEQQPKLPLIRLRLVYTREEHMFNAMRFGQTFNEKVANPTDVVSFKKAIKRCKKEGEDLDKNAFQEAFKNMELEANSRLEDLLERYFDNAEESKKLQIFPTKLISELTFQMVEKHDPTAVETMLNNFEDKALERIMETLPNEINIDESFKQIQASITADDITALLNQRETSNNTTSTGPSAAKKRKANNDDDDDLTVLGSNDDDDNEIEDPVSKATTTRGRGASRARARGSRGRGGRGGGGAATTTTSVTVPKSTPRSTASNTRATNKHTMPTLNVSVNQTRQSPRKPAQQTSLESFIGGARRNKVRTYIVSDSDSD